MEAVDEEPCYILNIPNELQLLIFDKMDQRDKISFGKVSRKCRAIWKESRSFFDGISWYKFDESIEIDILLNVMKIAWYSAKKIHTSDNAKNCEHGLEFAKWKFVKKLEKYQKTVKSITIYGECSANLRNISSFPSLRYLILRDCPNIVREVLSKSGDALEYLEIDEWNNNYADCPEIYRVSDYLSINFELTREQLFKLSAKKIIMPIGGLKAEDIFEFIKSWQNGRRNLEYCKWDLYFFDAPKFFGFFNTEVVNRYKRIIIRGPGETSAQIIFRKKKVLIFEVVENSDVWMFDWDVEGLFDSDVDYREYSYETHDDA
ncbi:unnamed protein product [Caenorhabditis angaria]|uniref:F-box domain-containing protein n=1 Tax=Caenorhabditis angaria TaxID=860376 RepID=A0A9P1IR56_9PELO|nr:unnamed protein product [Caenorhabditis angaria]